MVNPEQLWGVCRNVCADCPNVTDRTAKKACKHPWRAEVEKRHSQSVDGTVPFDTPEVVHALGATVSRHETDGARPSFQLFGEKPAEVHGRLVVRIAEE